MDKVQLINEVFSLLKNEILENDNSDRKVLEYKTPEELKAIFQNNFENGSTEENLLENIKNYINYSSQ
jgi:uncharacterized protein YuzB (UPF0349 family)